MAASTRHGHGANPGMMALALIPAALFVFFGSLLGDVGAGHPARVVLPWVPSMGVNLSFLLDGLSLLFVLLITGIGAFVMLYSSSYMAEAERRWRFSLILLAFMAAMLGVVLADNLIALFVFWELTTITSFLLIGCDNTKPEAKTAARQGLLVTGAGGLAMLAGIILLGQVAGSFEISEIIAGGQAISEHDLYPVILGLILIGAFTKSAQVPFHFWLPGAMAAPTPVSAYLHSATMVKAGIYLLARLSPVLGGTGTWMIVLTVVGAVTAVWASIQALRQQDLKSMLAYTTLMALGSATMFLGAAEEVGLTAAVTFVLVHALYKASLFMVVGIVDHQTGTRRLDALGGLRKAMPITAIAATLSALSMAGLPPFIGFVGKELMYTGALAWEPEPAVAISAIVLAKVLMVAVAVVIIVRTFFGPPTERTRDAVEAPWQLWIGPLVMGLLALLGGVLPDFVGETLLIPATMAVMGACLDLELSLWHGINVPLLLSGLTLIVGVLIARRIDGLKSILDALARRAPHSASQLFESGVSRFVSAAGAFTSTVQHGVLRSYLRTVFATAALLVGVAGVVTGAFTTPPDLEPLAAIALEDGAVVLLIITGAIVTLLTRSRLLAIGALGVVGTGLALLFMLYGAPDLAITQLLVETLVVVIAALVLLRLPVEKVESKPREKGLDAVVAIAMGTVSALLLLGVTGQPTDPSLARFFEENAVPGGYGRNIVNVILVDFRAFDTLGEIVVVTVAGLAGISLLRPADEEGRLSLLAGTTALKSLIVSQSSRVLVVLMLMFSVFMFLRGHNEPGGGFIGGLIASTAFALAALGSGAATVRRAIRVEPRAMAVTGLIVALIAGLIAMLGGAPFLTGVWATLAGIKLGTPLLFDAGVYLVVVGTVLAFILGLKEAR